MADRSGTSSLQAMDSEPTLEDSAMSADASRQRDEEGGGEVERGEEAPGVEGGAGPSVAGQEAEDAQAPVSTDGDQDGEPEGRCSSFTAWLSSNAFLIYTSQFLSSWGDRMWTFAVALYLVEIEDNSLRLTAVFGFALTVSVLLFGALVGKWVDRTPRLNATSRSLFVQNISVVLNAVCLILLLHYKADVQKVGGGALFFFCQMVIIFLGVVANLASVAEKICIEKDWVVILAGDDTDKLTEMNATVRRIDLTVNILAPILVGQIMTFVSMTVAGIFIAAWNLISLVVEYSLLLKVYKRVPRLSTKFSHKVEDDAPARDNITGAEQSDIPLEQGDKDTGTVEGSAQEDSAGASAVMETGSSPEATNIVDNSVDMTSPDELPEGFRSSQPSDRSTGMFLSRAKDWLLSSYHGWLIYKSYPVYLAGLAMAFLYMTVMGFDSITNSYGYSMGLSEAMLGVVRALGSLAGIVGTFAYPRLRQRIGATRSGLYSLSEEILCLTLCILSVWAPGSPFDPDYYSSPKGANSTTVRPFSTSVSPTSVPSSSALASLPSRFGLPPPNTSGSWSDSPALRLFVAEEPSARGSAMSTPALLVGGGDRPTHTTPTSSPAKALVSYASPVLFFTGMVLSRVGLWMFDLVVSQLIQENVRESERGIFNGMQRSLECFMDMLHFILVIALPSPATFGYLILLSFLFICVGAVLYCVFAYRDRGHLFHPEKLTSCLRQNGVPPRRLQEENPAV